MMDKETTKGIGLSLFTINVRLWIRPRGGISISREREGGFILARTRQPLLEFDVFP
jgi:hypothetical protein